MYFLDAHTGSVVLKIDDLKSEAAKGIGKGVLGDDKKMKLVPVSFVQRFPALQSGDIDVIVKNTSWTLSRNTELGLQFSAPYMFTGVGIMVYKSLGVTKGTDLDGATICTTAGTTLEKATADFFAKHNKKYKLLTFENGNERDQAAGQLAADAAASSDPLVGGDVDLRLRAAHRSRATIRIVPLRNGFDRFSSPIVVAGPCPE